MSLHRLKLSKADWEEIAYALANKASDIEDGEFGAEDHPGADVEWIKHLNYIIKTIGSDGQHAVKRGVAPVE